MTGHILRTLLANLVQDTLVTMTRKKTPAPPADLDLASARRGRGRPRDESLPRERMWLRIDSLELAEWAAEADRLGLSLSAWVRQTCNAVVRKR